MKKILVTGGAGYIGSHVAKVLANKGYEVIIIDNFSTGHRSFISALGLKCYESCISNKELVTQILKEHRIDAVMHFSALACVGEGQKEPGRYIANNVTATQILLDAMLAAGVKDFVFSSTCAVFGNPETSTLNEMHSKNPISVYGLTKLWVEQMLSAYESAYGLRSMIFRYFNAAGALSQANIGEDHRPETHLIPLALKAALSGGEVAIFGSDYPTKDGTCVRDYIHVLDLADAHILGLEWLLENQRSENINLGTGRGNSVLEIVESCRRVCKREIRARLAERRAGDPAFLVADPSKALAVIGWKAKHLDLDMTVNDAWDWFKLRFA